MSPDEIRARSFQTLDALGFRAARWLPLPEVPFVLRPLPEIARRLMALDALFTWVAFDEEGAPSERVQRYVQTNGLGSGLTTKERSILLLPCGEAREHHQDTIGWRLENMWSPTWALGFGPEPDLQAAQIDDDVIHSLVHDFMPGLDGTALDLLARAQHRDAETVGRPEDLFSCVHNAVRSAQLGSDTVPPGSHPILHGGAVHERRHALTWMLSPGVPWEETDLST